MNASEIQFAMETDAQNVPEGSTSFASVLVDQQRANDVPGVAASDLASTTSVPATPTETRYLETVERDSEELENVGFVQRRSLLSSTLLPVSNKHPSKEDIVELDIGTLSPDGAQSQVENWTESLRISKYEMDDNGECLPPSRYRNLIYEIVILIFYIALLRSKTHPWCMFIRDQNYIGCGCDSV